MRLTQTLKRAALLASVPVIATFSTGSALAAATFGPNRATFTEAHPATYITFNSITDNSSYGDERYLLEVRDSTASTSTYAKSSTVTDGEEVVLEAYFHNNAASNLNLVAHNVTARFALPSGYATTQTPTAYISASNSNPGEVWATADLTSSTPFSLSYEAGTAKLYTNYVTGAAVNDSVVTTGAPVGSHGADGNVPGCENYSGYVTIRAKVNFKQTPAPTPTPQPPKPAKTQALPNTGAGSTAAMFVGATVLAGALHYLNSARKLGQR